MGILNVTPDSFFDGGRYRRLDRALERSERMVEEGADILDVGGESTRPGARPVALHEELARVVPVVRGLVKRFPRIVVSVDTQKAGVARAALDEGAGIVNDVSALRTDPEMWRAAADYKARVVLMHMRGNPGTMQKSPSYKNVVREVKQFLNARILWAMERGIPKNRIWVDPGIGFGKTASHNLQLLSGLSELQSLGCPVVMGCSRKSFIGRILGRAGRPVPAEERLEGSLAAGLWAVLEGASILRVHDVAATRRALAVFQSIRSVA